jgi:hypothetical protein
MLQPQSCMWIYERVIKKKKWSDECWKCWSQLCSSLQCLMRLSRRSGHSHSSLPPRLLVPSRRWCQMVTTSDCDRLYGVSLSIGSVSLTGSPSDWVDERSGSLDLGLVSSKTNVERRLCLCEAEEEKLKTTAYDTGTDDADFCFVAHNI